METDAVFDWADTDSLLRVFLRMTLAALLGGLVGLEREMTGKAAGLRTHMLVSLGAAMFVLTPLEVGMGVGDLSRVIQGVVTGVGFLGAGAILKRDEEGKIHGLTTAASVWLTAAVGAAVGAGRFWLPALAVGFSLAILFVLGRLERHVILKRGLSEGVAQRAEVIENG